MMNLHETFFFGAKQPFFLPTWRDADFHIPKAASVDLQLPEQLERQRTRRSLDKGLTSEGYNHLLRRTFTLLLMFAALGFSAACTTNFADDIIQGEIATYTGMAIALVVVLVVAAYMIGTASNNVNLLLFAKDEMFHLGISLMLIMTIGGFLIFSCTIISGFLDFSLQSLLGGSSTCYSGTESPSSVARCYIAVIEGDARSMLRSATRESVRYEMSSGMIFGLYNPLTGGIMTPLDAEKKTYGMQLDMVSMTFILPALTSISMQKFFLNFGIDFIRYLLPAALFFRVLPKARTMGNLLIAVAIAMYVFLPTMYALNAAMDEVIFRSPELGCTSGSDTEELIKDTVMGDCDSLYNFWAVARLLPQAYFLPNLTLAVTITFLSGINKALKVLT